MDSILGTYQRGHVLLDEPVNWPEGSRVVIAPANKRKGLTEEEWPDTPEGIAALLANLDAVEPLEFTPEEEAEIAAAREEVRRMTIEAVRKQMGLAP
jgi:hypothetical protein